jgi:hypothetical protein
MKRGPAVRLIRLKRAALLLGAVMLVAATSVLGSTVAHALAGTQPGDVSISPSAGSVTTTGITYTTTTGCSPGNQGSGLFRLVDPGSAGITNLAPVNNSVAEPFSGTFNTTFSTLSRQPVTGNQVGYPVWPLTSAHPRSKKLPQEGACLDGDNERGWGQEWPGPARLEHNQTVQRTSAMA